MPAVTEPEHTNAISLSAAISRAIVKLLPEYTGRGPTKARTTIRDNVVVVMLEQTLTKGESAPSRRRAAGRRCSRSATSSKRRCTRRAAPRSPS
jgi:uncharacterized protein YbcI